MSKEKKTALNLSLEELKAKASELEEQLFKFKMQKVTGQLANTSLIKIARRELARIRTVQGQKLSTSAQVREGK